MLKDTKSLGNNKAPACESRGFVLKKEGVLFDTPSLFFPNWEKIGVFSGFARFCTLVFLAIRIGFRNFEAVKPKNKTYEFH